MANLTGKMYTQETEHRNLLHLISEDSDTVLVVKTWILARQNISSYTHAELRGITQSVVAHTTRGYKGILAKEQFFTHEVKKVERDD